MAATLTDLVTSKNGFPISKAEAKWESSSLKKDLGAESIDFIDIVFRLEREFDFRIVRGELFSDSDIDSKSDFPVSMIADFVEKKLNEKH